VEPHPSEDAAGRPELASKLPADGAWPNPNQSHGINAKARIICAAGKKFREFERQSRAHGRSRDRGTPFEPCGGYGFLTIGS
jgi:hypothetical protein